MGGTLVPKHRLNPLVGVLIASALIWVFIIQGVGMIG